MFNRPPIVWSQHNSVHTYLSENRHSSDLRAVVCPSAARVIQRIANCYPRPAKRAAGLCADGGDRRAGPATSWAKSLAPGERSAGEKISGGIS